MISHVTYAKGLGLELAVAACHPDSAFRDFSQEVSAGMPFGITNRGHCRGPGLSLYDVAEVDA